MERVFAVVKVKICGLTNSEDALAAHELGADYLGFVLYARSPRGITPEVLAGICRQLPRACRVVAVFVNESRSVVERTVGECGLAAVQLHGDEQERDWHGLACPVWRAVREHERVWDPDPAGWACAERLVVDAAPPGMYGGAGMVADWDSAAVLARERPVLLAGGLTPANVAAAVRAVSPYGVDVSSGVEAKPGRKDLGKVRDFIRGARS